MLASLILVSLTSLALFLPALAVGEQAEPSTGDDYNGFPPELMGKNSEMATDFRDVGDIPIQVINPLDTSWHPFLFTNAGSYGSLRFQVTTSTAFNTWQITDYYCAGDQFQVFVNEALTSINTSYIASFPTAISCANYTTNPDVANNDPELAWSRFSGTLIALPGTFTFTIYTLQSPFSAGKAAFRWVG